MTKLGDNRTVRSRGRFARVMGTLWRCEKREQCGRAAMGLLMDIWSWCADQQTDVVSEKAMRKLLAGDPNGRRQLAELVKAGFLDAVEGGHSPHDWHEHSGHPAQHETGAEMEVRRECDEPGDEGVTRDVTRHVTRHEMNTPPENTQEITSPRACAFPRSQIPEKREGEDAPPPKPPRTVNSAQLQTLQDIIAAEAEGQGFTRTPKATRPQYVQAVEGVWELQKSMSLGFEAASRTLARAALSEHQRSGKGFGFVLTEIDPARPAGAERQTTPAAAQADLAKRYPTQRVEETTSWK